MPDNLTPQQRSYCMSRIKGKDTSLERTVRSALHKKGFRFRKNMQSLPGKPDIVFTKAKVAVFVDGDFWHGYNFDIWRHKLSVSWEAKIQKNIERDKRNFALLKKEGWQVIRIWEHEVKDNLETCIERIEGMLAG